MLTVIMGYGDCIHQVERVTINRHGLDNYAKRLYSLYRSQEIYCFMEASVCWNKPVFKMQVSGQQMHPKSVEWKQLEDHEVPKEIRIRHLMGAL